MIKHVIFDLGNVLIEIHPEEAMGEFAERCNYSQEQITAFYLSDLHLGFMEGKYTPEQFFHKLRELYPCDISQQEFYEIWQKVIGRPKQGVIELIEDLKKKYILSVCSNTDPWHWSVVWKRDTFLRDFKYFFLSFEMKLNKPDPQVFQTILQKLNARGDECVFVDDSPVNIEVANRFGFWGILGNEPKTIRNEMEKLQIL
ncbi:MAG: HAD family phosphatase [Calditrichia bacterium]